MVRWAEAEDCQDCAFADAQSDGSDAATLAQHETCGRLRRNPCPARSRKHACGHATSVQRPAWSARQRASRRPTRSPWCGVSRWIWNAPTFAGLPQLRSPEVVNTCKPSARSARTRAEAARQSAASTAWTTASVAPSRARAVQMPALQWRTEHPYAPAAPPPDGQTSLELPVASTCNWPSGAVQFLPMNGRSPPHRRPTRSACRVVTPQRLPTDRSGLAKPRHASAPTQTRARTVTLSAEATTVRLVVWTQPHLGGKCSQRCAAIARCGRRPGGALGPASECTPCLRPRACRRMPTAC